MEAIMDSVLKLVGTLAGMALCYAATKLAVYFKERLTQKGEERLSSFIRSLVAGAEQLYKEIDEDGTIRFEYVTEILVEHGYEITEAIRALIEAEVYKINQGGVSQ